MINAAMLSSEKMDWETPANVLELVREFNGGRIGLDPCTSEDNPCDARVWFTPEDNGLTEDWTRLGLVYVNPPYGRDLIRWAGRMYNAADDGAEIIGLVPARTDTRWFQDYIRAADAICFWRGRIKFKGATSGAPFPCALPYWGPRVDRFREVFGPYGWIP